MNTQFLAPKFWPIWLGLFLLRLITLFPQQIRMWIGRQLGRTIYFISPKRQKIAAINLQLCFPELDQLSRDQLMKDHFLSLGMALIDTAVSWWKPDQFIKNLAEIEGLEHIDNALKEGKGVILLSAHFNTLEFGLRLLSANVDYPLFAVYQANSNPLLEHIITSNRKKNAGDVISHKDIKKMLRCLKKNCVVWYAPDQGYMGKYGEMVPFFDIPASSNTATSRLAKISRSAVIPFFVRQKPDYSGYVLTLKPALEDFPGDSVLEDTHRYHRLIEDEIKLAPEQYLWIHRRFKRRPAPYPNLYENINLRTNK